MTGRRLTRPRGSGGDRGCRKRSRSSISEFGRRGEQRRHTPGRSTNRAARRGAVRRVPSGPGTGVSEIPILAKALKLRLAMVRPVTRAAVCGWRGFGAAVALSPSRMPCRWAAPVGRSPNRGSSRSRSWRRQPECWPGSSWQGDTESRTTFLTAGLAGGLLGLLASALVLPCFRASSGCWDPWSGIDHSRPVALGRETGLLVGLLSNIGRPASSHGVRQVEHMMGRQVGGLDRGPLHRGPSSRPGARHRPMRRSRRQFRGVSSSSSRLRPMPASGEIRAADASLAGHDGPGRAGFLENGISREAQRDLQGA